MENQKQTLGCSFFLQLAIKLQKKKKKKIAVTTTDTVTQKTGFKLQIHSVTAALQRLGLRG